MIEKPQWERQGCGLLWLHRAAGLCRVSDRVAALTLSLPWLCHLATGESSWENSRALEGVIPIQSKLYLVLGVKIGVNNPSCHTHFRRINLFWQTDLSQPSQCSQFSASPALLVCSEPADQSSLASHKFGFRQREFRSASKPNQTTPTPRILMSHHRWVWWHVFHSYCRSCVEWN